jgi:rhamnulokinase
MLGCFDGERMAVEEITRFPNGAVEVAGRYHWDTLRLFSDIKGSIKAATERAPDLASIGVTSWGVDFALLDSIGALIGNPYSHRDPRRLRAGLEEVWRLVGRDEIYRRTGIHTRVVNSLFQLAALRLEQPYALQAASAFLMIGDLLNYWLTGERASEHMLATTSQCVDVQTRDWARDLLERLGLPTHMFPPIVQPGTVLGPLLRDVAEELAVGRLPKIVVTIEHDTGASITGTPLSSPRAAIVSSGTSMMVGAEIDQPIVNQASERLHFSNEAGINGTFQCLKHLMGFWLLQACRRSWQARGHSSSYDELTVAADRATPFAAAFDPEWTDLLRPGDVANRILQHCRDAGYSPSNDPATLCRIIFESLALDVRRALGMLEELRGFPADVIHLNGGGVRNRLFCQLIADATQTPVVAGPIEAAIYGNLCVQGMAHGRLRDLEELRAIVSRSVELQTYEPDPLTAPRWEEHFRRFLEIAAQETYGAGM